MKNWLNEAVEEEGTKIIFKDFCEDHFYGNYDSMINWLNENGRTQRAYFIGEKYEIIYKCNSQKYWDYVKKYSKYYSKNEDGRVEIIFNSDQHGGARGLIYLDHIDLPNQKPPRIRWYKNGKLSND